MKSQPRVASTGLFDARYADFLKTVSHLRGPLHRYCARMTGSAMDGEDIMQDALFEAYCKVDQLQDRRALQGWLFRIAHNRCIDFLRNRKARQRAEANYAQEKIILPVEPAGFGAGRAIERLVIHLPPKERACVLLKDVFDYSLGEIAELVGSTVGGVKSALNRGRTKLAFLPALPAAPPAAAAPDPQLSRLLDRYVDLFNRRDWDGVRALASADARLRVSDCFNGLLVDSPYFAEFERAQAPWRIDIGEVEGEAVLIVLFEQHDGWIPTYPVRVRVRDGLIDAITDYYACPWLFSAADNVRVNGRAIFDSTEKRS
ncbi:sigma-70 family RNA polymerase sigma factor [Rhizobium rhizogenes]|uniref:sigma-70 family RNA polymerase sigma factor n=1 Tax=Rhizobium rhizogenes TaxID=359 RepID=UPI001574A14F|nr:sigma-70 family RNA polymerase sigma factor [Rhizobium rhizogenes]NTF44204.1 sigma-70 family RNA polymerase sigma factor [Rhizobium rhizogenes]